MQFGEETNLVSFVSDYHPKRSTAKRSYCVSRYCPNCNNLQPKLTRCSITANQQQFNTPIRCISDSSYRLQSAPKRKRNCFVQHQSLDVCNTYNHDDEALIKQVLSSWTSC